MTRAAKAAVVGSAATALVASFLLSPLAVMHGPVLCPFRRLVGAPCPGCGLSRSFVFMAHGAPGDAFTMHPFGPAAWIACWLLVALFVAERLLGRELVRSTLRRLRVPLYTAASVWVAWAVVRLLG